MPLGYLFPKDGGSEEGYAVFKYYLSISLFFLKKVVVLQICHWVYSHKFNSTFIDDIRKHKFK